MTNFVDEVAIEVQSGAGGNGVVAWRREKYVPFGGPAGGDGGRGGSVVLQATSDLNTLLDFQYRSVFKAPDGEQGRSKNQHGRAGSDLTIRVPVGTVVRDAETRQAIADLNTEGAEALVASGGRGGRGNSRFSSSQRQAPHYAEPGEPSIHRRLLLELKLLADVGIIGLPNAGKSTFISVVSAAKPKIADYPFTTLTPNLGVVQRPGSLQNGKQPAVLADIPGLIEGASHGAGLGHAFLRHVERTRVLLHLVRLAEPDVPPENLPRDVVARYELIRQELAQYSALLAKKPEILVLSQADAVSPDAQEAARQALQTAAQGASVWVMSAITRSGVEAVLTAMFDALDHVPAAPPVVDIVPDPKALDHDDSAFDIHHVPRVEGDGQVFEITGGKVTRLVRVTDLTQPDAVRRFVNILKAMGVYRALEAAGARPGDDVYIAGHGFEYQPEKA
jgi:GTP-binding protein